MRNDLEVHTNGKREGGTGNGRLPIRERPVGSQKSASLFIRHLARMIMMKRGSCLSTGPRRAFVDDLQKTNKA